MKRLALLTFCTMQLHASDNFSEGHNREYYRQEDEHRERREHDGDWWPSAPLSEHEIIAASEKRNQSEIEHLQRFVANMEAANAAALKPQPKAVNVPPAPPAPMPVLSTGASSGTTTACSDKSDSKSSGAEASKNVGSKL